MTTRASSHQDLENERSAMKHRLLLVLYPEIEGGSRRTDHHHQGHRPGSPPPLDQDYHSRDIRLALGHARLPDMKEKPTRGQMLEAESRLGTAEAAAKDIATLL